MKKEELIHEINRIGLDKDIFPYRIILDKITDSPLVLGCVLNNGEWIVYKTRERGGHYVVRTFKDEDHAFDFFYETLLFYKKLRSH